MNSHQRRAPGFRMRSSYLQMRIRASWQIARQRHNVRIWRGNMTGRGVKGKKKSSRCPSRFPPSLYFYPACLRCWRCSLVLSQPAFDIKTDSSAMQACLSSRVILSVLTSWYQPQDVTFVFPNVLTMPSGSGKGAEKCRRLEALCKFKT